MDTKHTPTPWHVGVKPSGMVYGPQGEQVVAHNVLLDYDEVKANAAHIVHCVNQHDALVRALQEVHDFLTGCGTLHAGALAPDSDEMTIEQYIDNLLQKEIDHYTTKGA